MITPGRHPRSSAAVTRAVTPARSGSAVRRIIASVSAPVSRPASNTTAATGDIEFGSLWGHGQPMRRLIESGALRGDRFLQVGLRGYWPPPETLDWMAGQQMRSFEMTEIGHRGLDPVLTEAFTIATDDCDGVFLSVDIDVCDPGHAPGTGTPEPGGLSARQLLDAVRRICLELPVVGRSAVR